MEFMTYFRKSGPRVVIEDGVTETGRMDLINYFTLAPQGASVDSLSLGGTGLTRGGAD